MITKRQSDKESFYLDAEPEPILVHIVRSRRKTYGLLVRPTGEVEARIPLRGSVRRAREVAAQNQDWILDKCPAGMEGDALCSAEGRVRRFLRDDST